MAGEKMKGKTLPAQDQEHHGAEERGEKPKRSVVQERRGGEEKGSKIRKVTQEEVGELQINKERDKPMEVEKMTRLEEKGMPKLAPGDGDESSARERREQKMAYLKKPSEMTREEKIAFLKMIVEEDCDDMEIPEYAWPFFPNGLAGVKLVNDTFRTSVKEFKESAALLLKEEFNVPGFV